MSIQGWLTLVVCAGLLALALLGYLRAGHSPLALPLALLCTGFFSWNMAALAYDVSGDVKWRFLDVATSPFTSPLSLHFVVVFIGRWRELRSRVLAAYAVFSLLGACGLLALVSPAMASFAGSPLWALVHMLMAVPIVVAMVLLIRRHLRASSNPEEQIRTRLLLVAVIIGGALASTELLADIGTGIPRGGSLGALAAAAVLSIVALRFRLLEGELSTKVVGYSIAFGVLALVAYLGVFYLLAPSIAMVVFGTATVTLALGAALREIFSSVARHRERMDRLAILGRFSAQMAHDIKNPLAAAKGALQYLKEEQRRGVSLDEHGEFIDLVADQIERIGEVVEGYERVGQVRPEVTPLSVNDVISSVLASQRFAAAEGIEIRSSLSSSLPQCRGDRELLTRAVENLLRNSLDAMPSGGTITVRTRSEPTTTNGPVIAVSVEDDGPGMDARTAERACDDFYTTKARGSGLGLAFVRRVAEAHGGEISLSSELGKGTEVVLRFPVK